MNTTVPTSCFTDFIAHHAVNCVLNVNNHGSNYFVHAILMLIVVINGYFERGGKVAIN